MKKHVQEKLNKVEQDFREVKTLCTHCVHKRYILNGYKQQIAKCGIGGFRITREAAYTCNAFTAKPKTPKRKNNAIKLHRTM